MFNHFLFSIFLWTNDNKKGHTIFAQNFYMILLDKAKRCSSNSTIKILSEEKQRSNTKLFCLFFYRKADSLLITLSHYLRQKNEMVRWLQHVYQIITKGGFCVLSTKQESKWFIRQILAMNVRSYYLTLWNILEKINKTNI